MNSPLDTEKSIDKDSCEGENGRVSAGGIMRPEFKLIRNSRGMTLIEIMIVLIIVGGLMAILGQKVIGQLGKAQMNEAKIQIAEIGKSLDMFYADCGFYPPSEKGLQALVENPGDCQSWGPDPYLKKLPKDPWKNDLVYQQKSRSSYVLMSMGADGAEGGEGKNADISSENLN